MKKTDLKNYAKLIVRIGANVQKNQRVIIRAAVGDAYFVKYVVEECYKAKAKDVTVEWNCDEVSKLHYKYQKLETLQEVPNWKIEKMKYQAEELPAMIHIISDDPDAMGDVDQEKLMNASQALRKIMKPYRDEMENKYQWTIVAIPGEAWAKKLFPGVSSKKAIESLWDAIFKTARVYGDPVKNWEEHNATLVEKCEKLNKLNIKTLTYKSSNGTDFNVSLTGKTVFEGGIATTYGGVRYNPNMPTEECFTSPDKKSANGVVYSTKPLSVMGTLIDKFGFKFENGRVVEIYGDEKAKSVLSKLTSIDEGASQLGEVALVPFNSPVNETGILFLNTLFDENACCHLAIGMGFEDTIKDFTKLTKEEIKAVDLNDSAIHVDFMIGSADLSIVGTTFDGQQVQIFKDGTWAI